MEMTNAELTKQLMDTRAELAVLRDATALLLASLCLMTKTPIQKLHSEAMGGLAEAGAALKLQGGPQSGAIDFSVAAAEIAADQLYAHAQTHSEFVRKLFQH